MKRALLLLAACGSSPPPVIVSSGGITATIASDQITITSGSLTWQTAPHQLAQIAAIDATISAQVGSFKFSEPVPGAKWRTIDRLGHVTATASGATFELYVGDSKVGTGTLTLGDHVQIQLHAEAERIALGQAIDDTEHLVGCGGMSFSVDHRGEKVPLWVQEDGIGKDQLADDDYSGVWFLSGRQHSTHTPMPMLLSSRGYALVVDTNARAVFDLTGPARYEVWQPDLDLELFVPGEPRAALGQMISWVGKPDAPSPVVFAPWVDAIFGSANVRAVAQALRTNGVSSSVIWTEDWRGGSDGALGYALTENWQVDRTLYPDIEQLASDLHAEGFDFLVYFNTFIDSTADIYNAATSAGYGIHDSTGATYMFTGTKFDPATMLDLTNAAGVTWAKGIMTEALTEGADGWMADFGEWLQTDAVLESGEDALATHNRYTVDWAKMNHDLLAGRGIYFMRSAWLHSQPFANVMWLGDQQTDFTTGDGFPSTIPISIGLGLTGFPYVGSDVAGYMSQGTNPTDEELFYRWTTFGALSPVMRTHHGRSARQNFQWQHDAQSIAHFRRWARLHQQLASYLQGESDVFQQTGLPLFRMIGLEFPADDFGWTTVDEYMLGDRILVAPVIAQGALDRMVTLPSGNWLPLLGGAAVSGTFDAPTPLTEIPAFVPEGSLLVLYPDGIASVLTPIGDDREVWLYPGTASDPSRASWQSQWTWSGRPLGAGAPASAMWNGQPVAITQGVVTVTGDGTLTLDGGGTLTITRGLPAAHVTVRVY
jgi:alpha-glucosidase (family GH31 glycosyl hydrolase)